MMYLLVLPFRSLTGIDLLAGPAPHMALKAAGATVKQNWLESTSSALSSWWTDSVGGFPSRLDISYWLKGDVDFSSARAGV